MPRYRCNLCSEPPRMTDFESEAERPHCPNAARPVRPCRGELGRGVIELDDVHYLAFHPEGPILAAEGPRRIPCQPEREVLAMPYNLGGHFSATAEPSAVTCPACKASELFKEQLAIFRPDVRLGRPAKPRVPKG
jgi:hypothetical protein